MSDKFNEALYLFIVAALGFFFNVCVITCILTCKTLRKMTSAFIIHGCLLDMIKCLYCIPFATSLLRNIPPNYCTLLGGSYVVIVTASGFNIVAMICCEAYSFSEHNLGHEGKGSLCCVIFGVLMVYIGSIIIHLGPTIIGGDFNYNDLIGNCIFVYGTIKSYVVHAMWIAIMTIAMVGAVYYLVFFYRYVQANSTHRLASLVRASIAISRGSTQDNTNVRKIVRDSLVRARVLMTITTLFIVCWYPLFVLTLVDPKFKQPTKIYKLLTFIAWSNAALNPVVLILFDRHINVCRRVASLRSCIAHDEEDPDIPLMPSTSRPSSLGRSATSSLSRGASTQGSLQPGGGLYQRVGCRLCHEGQTHNVTPHCNGGVGPSGQSRVPEAGRGGGMRQDSSMCELHSLS